MKLWKFCTTCFTFYYAYDDEGRILLEIFLAFSSFPALDSIVNCEHEKKISASSSNVELAEKCLIFITERSRFIPEVNGVTHDARKVSNAPK